VVLVVVDEGACGESEAMGRYGMVPLLIPE